MRNPIKKVAAINDLSGYGRAALTTIIPIVSAMGIQVCPFPTAVLSTHTGGFNSPTFIDLTNYMDSYMNHWKVEGVNFDCIYSGYLGSAEQVDIVLEFIKYFKNDETLVVVDPVMGDNGKLYSAINRDMVDKMSTLIKKANIITPNLTEAFYLLDRKQAEYTDEFTIKEMMVELSGYGPDIVIITSVAEEPLSNAISVHAYDNISKEYFKISSEKLSVNFPGTGDAFTSVLIGSILNGEELGQAIKRSVEFVTLGIRESLKYSYPKREGILLERVLYSLICQM